MTRGRILLAPMLGASLAAVLVLSARGAKPAPPAPRAAPAAAIGASSMSLSARPVITGDEVVTLTEVLGLRKSTPGDFSQESDAHANGRIFIDTTDAGEILATPDQQRVKLSVDVTPSDLEESDYEIRWEVRDPDDPANDAALDSGPQGGDNTGTAHELVSFWFVQADHAISGQSNSPPVNETTVIGQARTAITRVGPNLVSTVYFRFADDGGDNYRIRAVLRLKSPAQDLDTDETGVLTIWRKRAVGVYAMTKPNDDVQAHALGSNPGPFAVCITAGANGQSDTMAVSGDDAHRGELVHAGANGVVETAANSGGASFDPEATAELFRSTYATAGPNQLAYIDWEVTNEQLDRPYRANLKSSEVPDYMHALTDFVHVGALTSLLGANALEALAGDATYPPHCGVAVGTLKQVSPSQLPKTDIHEIGHLLIGAFEPAGSFHNTHSISQVCGFRQGLHPAQICSRHANLLRDRAARAFGPNHTYFEVVSDSALSR